MLEFVVGANDRGEFVGSDSVSSRPFMSLLSEMGWTEGVEAAWEGWNFMECVLYDLALYQG